MSEHSEIVSGMAEIYWGLAWADWMDENGKSNELSGKDILEIMPPIPDKVYYFCYRVLGKIEEANNNQDEYLLLFKALEADGFNTGDWLTNKDQFKEYRKEFGRCLAYESLDSGVTWGDNHVDIDIKIPSCETEDIRVLVDDMMSQ